MFLPVGRRALAVSMVTAFLIAHRVPQASGSGPLDRDPASTWTEIAALNVAINRIEQRPDRETWGFEDHWATPRELAALGAGDCEDLAVAKFFALLERGVPPVQLRLLLVQLWRPVAGRIEPHLVVAWHPEGDADPWILDNVDDRILRLSARRDLVPRLAFDRGRWWLHAGNRAVEQTTPVPLAQWRALLARLEAKP